MSLSTEDKTLLSQRLAETFVGALADLVGEVVKDAIAAEREACAATLEAMAKRGESAEIRAAYSLRARAIRART